MVKEKKCYPFEWCGMTRIFREHLADLGVTQNHREASDIPHQYPEEVKIGRDITFDLKFASNSGFCA
jgi:hypothetical protein